MFNIEKRLTAQIYKKLYDIIDPTYNTDKIRSEHPDRRMDDEELHDYFARIYDLVNFKEDHGDTPEKVAKICQLIEETTRDIIEKNYLSIEQIYPRLKKLDEKEKSS